MNQHVVATPIPRNNSVDATNYNAPQVSKDYIVQQQADWAQPRRVMKPLPGRLPASNRAMKRYIDAMWVYLWALWFVQLVQRLQGFYWISRQAASTVSLLIVAGDVQAIVDCMWGDNLWCPAWRFSLLFNASGFYSIHPFENRICSADACAVLFIFCFCVASLVEEKSWHN